MPQSQKDQHTIAYVAKDDGDRLAFQHNIFKPSFLEGITQVLDQYGLADRLQAAKLTGAKVRILDFGCGEGLYLLDLAEVLEARGLLEGAELNGLDISPQMIEAARTRAYQSKPSRPYLNFYVHDGTRPLAECAGLGIAQFDFIYALCALQHLPDARTHLQRLYRQDLTSGGVIYIREPVNEEGLHGWMSPHPALYPIQRSLNRFVAGINGAAVALYEATWLKEAGAERVVSSSTRFGVGDDTESGQRMLENLISFWSNSLPKLSAAGLITAEEFSQALADFRQKKVNPALMMPGQFTLANTLVHKNGLA